MKLATFRDGTRDGALAVVSRDLTKAVKAEAAVAGLRTLQQLLDDWQSTQLKVERIYAELNEAVDGRRPAPFDMVDFDEGRCSAPLPRAYQWADGSAYVNHVELVRRARGADMPASSRPAVRRSMPSAAARSIARTRRRTSMSPKTRRWASAPVFRSD